MTTRSDFLSAGRQEIRYVKPRVLTVSWGSGAADLATTRIALAGQVRQIWCC